MEEAHPMSTGWRSEAVKKYIISTWWRSGEVTQNTLTEK